MIPYFLSIWWVILSSFIHIYFMIEWNFTIYTWYMYKMANIIINLIDLSSVSESSGIVINNGFGNSNVDDNKTIVTILWLAIVALVMITTLMSNRNCGNDNIVLQGNAFNSYNINGNKNKITNRVVLIT
jgi:hypothetical protein